MFAKSACFLAAAALLGCASTGPRNPYSAKGYCFMQSGWQDSSSICSPLDSYTDCYLQCPHPRSDKPPAAPVK